MKTTQSFGNGYHVFRPDATEEVLLHFCPREWEQIQFLDHCVAFIILDNVHNP